MPSAEVGDRVRDEIDGRDEQRYHPPRPEEQILDRKLREFLSDAGLAQVARQAVGLATVERTAYPDPKQDNARLIVIDVRAGARLPRPVTLTQIKSDGRFADSPLVKMGRLSVVMLTDEQYGAILELAGM